MHGAVGLMAILCARQGHWGSCLCANTVGCYEPSGGEEKVCCLTALSEENNKNEQEITNLVQQFLIWKFSLGEQCLKLVLIQISELVSDAKKQVGSCSFSD